MLTHELRFVFYKLVVADVGSNALTHPLQRGVIGLGEGIVYLKFLWCHQLHFTVFITGILFCTIPVLEIEFLGTEYFSEMCDHCGLAGVRCAIEPDEVLLGVLSLEEYTVYGIKALSMSSLLNFFDIVCAIVILRLRVIVDILLHAFLESNFVLLLRFQGLLVFPEVNEEIRVVHDKVAFGFRMLVLFIELFDVSTCNHKVTGCIFELLPHSCSVFPIHLCQYIRTFTLFNQFLVLFSCRVESREVRLFDEVF